jgi:hypothetical protein
MKPQAKPQNSGMAGKFEVENPLVILRGAVQLWLVVIPYETATLSVSTR